MGDGEDGAEKNANTANNDVSNTEEGVASTHDSTGTDDDGLLALVFLCGENYLMLVRVLTSELLLLTIIDDDFIGSLFHCLLVISLVELAECWQTSGSHPDLESRPVCKVWRGCICRVVVGIAFAPVWWRQDIFIAILSIAIQVLIASPGNVGVVIHFVDLRSRRVGEKSGASEGVVEH